MDIALKYQYASLFIVYFMDSQFRTLRMQVQRQLTRCIRIAEQHFNRTFAMPAVSYDLRGVKAGVAYLQQNSIKLNHTLLLENAAEFIRQTVPHEAAHLIVYQVFGRVKPHGQEWRFVMERLFHLPAKTTHQFDVQNVQGNTFPYGCECRTYQLTTRRHNKIQRENAVYLCRKCKKILKFIGE